MTYKHHHLQRFFFLTSFQHFLLKSWLKRTKMLMLVSYLPITLTTESVNQISTCCFTRSLYGNSHSIGHLLYPDCHMQLPVSLFAWFIICYVFCSVFVIYSQPEIMIYYHTKPRSAWVLKVWTICRTGNKLEKKKKKL